MSQESYKFQSQRFLTIYYEDHSDFKDYPKNWTIDDGIPPRLRFKQKASSSSEEDFVKNFANPLTSVLKEYTLIVVEEKGDKVSLKFFWGYKTRKAGNVWFSTSKNVDYISVNLKTGNVYQGKLNNYQKKKKFTRTTKVNYFVNEPLQSFSASLKKVIDRYGGDGYSEVTKMISIFLDKIDKSKKFEYLGYDERLYKFYLDKKQIKYPNNFSVFKSVYYGPKFAKILKKNDKKLVETFMEIQELTGKKIKKSLHECEHLNVLLLKQAVRAFGTDWINQDKKLATQLLNSKVQVSQLQDDISAFASQEEMKKIFQMYKQVYIFQNLDSFTFADHLRMYVALKKYGEIDLRWMSTPDKGREFFHQEHIDWTEKIQFYTKGIYERVYPSYFYEMIEKQIFNYQPVILNSTSNYNEESFIQHNCVKTYIGRVSSFIVSLRNINDESRATIEYRVKKIGESILVNRVQTLGKYNTELDETWEDTLKVLDSVVSKTFSDSRFETVKLKKKCANGTELFSDSEFDDEGILGWTFNTIINEFGFYI